MTPSHSERELEARVAELTRRAEEAQGIERAAILLDRAEELTTRSAYEGLPSAEEALESIDGPSCADATEVERAALRARAAEALHLGGRVDRAREEAQRALDVLPTSELVPRAVAMRALAGVHMHGERFDEAMELVEEALRLVRRADGDHARAVETRLMIELGRGRYRQGRTEDASAAILGARRAALLRRDHAAEAICELNLGNIAWQNGDLEAALGHYRDAMKIQRELGALQSLATSLHNVACVHYETDDSESTLETIGDALAMRDSLRGNQLLPRLLLLMGRALLSLGRAREAADAMLEAYELYAGQEFAAGRSTTASALAEVHAKLGDRDESRRWIETALADLDTVRDHMSRGRACAGLARAEMALDDPRVALRHLETVRIEGADTRSRRLRVDLEMVQSEAHEALGQDAEALEHYRAGLALERELLAEGSRVRADRMRMLHRLEQGRYREDLLGESKVELERRVAERTEELEAKNRELRETLASHAALEARLRHTQKMEAIGRLAGGVAHDFNNLLVVIQGYGERLLRSSSPGEVGWDEASQILGSATRASRLTSQLLSFSRRDAYRERVFDLGELVTGMQHMLQRLIGEDVEVGVDRRGDRLPLLGDSGRIEQLVLDLVVHARDAMPKGGRLVLALDEHPEGTLRLALRHARQADGDGAAAALDDARAIAEGAGGDLVERDAGAERELVVTFPRHATEAAEPARDDDARQPDGPAPRVLLVDDEEGVRELVAGSLRAMGFDVTECANGQDALQRAIDDPRPFDLVVCDVVMPRMGGQALFEELRARGRTDPFLFVSGYTDRSDEFLERHADEVELLGKPFLLRQLEERVAEIMRKGGGRRAP